MKSRKQIESMKFWLNIIKKNSDVLSDIDNDCVEDCLMVLSWLDDTDNFLDEYVETLVYMLRNTEAS